jgi:acetate kinase
MPAAARTYALPSDWRAAWGLDRFGFHGLSHAWAARRGPAVAGRTGAEARRVVSCHLGAGASLCAIADGRSVETTMGFTPLEGVVMATRSGSVDPGLLLWLQTEARLSAEDVRDGLEHRSGLAGLSGTSGDMRDVLARRAGGDPSGALAFDVYVHRLRAGIGAMAAALDGLDVLVFTGGVGEHAAEVRSACAEGLGHLGVGVDPARNEAASTDADVSAAGAAASTVVVTAREDLEVARQVRDLLG